MLVRRMKPGDTLQVGEVLIEVQKATDKNLTLAIKAPPSVSVTHVESGRNKVAACNNPSRN